MTLQSLIHMLIQRQGRSAARLLPLAGLAFGAPVAAQHDASVEQMIVLGERVYPVVDTIAPSTEHAIDTAELLRELPGANLNANGVLSGIAQYRGLYGDRVTVTLDGLAPVTGGPNAMDTPLSYASPLLLEWLRLERGIPSVSSAVESLGGHISADYDRGRHGDGPSFTPAGKAQARYASNGELGSFAVQAIAASDAHKFALLGQRDRANDLDYPGGRLLPTRAARDRYDLSYAYRSDDVRIVVHGGRLDTYDTGTPALPMDIRSIETDLYGMHVDADIGRTTLDVAFGYTDVEHVMDNYGLRTRPATPAQYRSTFAAGSGWQFRVGALARLDSGDWRVGADGRVAEHSATITNPNVPAFRIENFDRAERDVVGLFGQWNRAVARFDLEAGVRVNHVRSDSGDASADIPAMNPMMEMMSMNAALLASDFNARDRSRSDTNVDAVLKIGRVLGGMRSVYLELGRKTRAPSYQELYLWMPLESTGGLADGRNYLGNPGLESEVSREINVGTSWHFGRSWVSPQIFYKDIDGFIQGVPSTNAVANAVSMMMGGAPALEFANTDAEMHGFDVAWGRYLTERLLIDGVVSYVRGKRIDVADNLYRLAPLNGRIALTYEAEGWSASAETVAYSAQNDVSAYNGERRTAGYGIVNLAGRWQPLDRVTLYGSVINALDKQYQDHLDGINRVTAVDVPVGERLYGIGRSVQVGVHFTW